MQEREEIESQFFDVRDFDLPRDGYSPEIKDLFPEWRDAIIRADGLVIVTPEYNHGYPGSLKCARPATTGIFHKAVALVGVSSHNWGGTRVIEACVPMVRELGLAVTFTDLHFPFAGKNSTRTGSCLTRLTKTAFRVFSMSSFGCPASSDGPEKTFPRNTTSFR